MAASSPAKKEIGFKWEKLTAICTFVLAIVATLALIFTCVQIRDSRDATRIERLVQVEADFDSPIFLSVRKNLASKRLDSKGHLIPLDKSNPPSEAYILLNYFEHVALLSKRGYLRNEDVWDEMGYWLSDTYADLKPVIQEEQKRDPNTYENFVELVMLIDKIDEKKHATRFPSQEELEEYYAGEKESFLSIASQHRKK